MLYQQLEAFTACWAKTRLGKVKLTCGLKIRHRLGKLWKGLRLTHREENFCLNPKYRCFAILSRRCKKPAIKRYFCSQSRHLLCRLWIIVVGAFEASLTKLTHSQRLEHLSLNQACRPGMKGKCTRPSILQISLFLTPALLAQIWFRFKKKKKSCWERPMAAIGRKIGSACAGRPPVISHVIGSLNFKLMPSRQSRRSPREQWVISRSDVGARAGEKNCLCKPSRSGAHNNTAFYSLASRWSDLTKLHQNRAPPLSWNDAESKDDDGWGGKSAGGHSWHNALD